MNRHILAALTGPVLGLLAMTPAAPASANPLHDGIPKFTAGEVKLDIRGRVLYDVADWRQDFALTAPDIGDSEWRAVRLGADVAFGQVKLTAEFDVAASDFQFTDLLAAWTPREGLTLTAGHFKEAFSLEELTSGRFTTFMERGSFTDAFDLGRRVGVSAALNGDRWSWTAALQASALDGFDMPGEDWAASSRVTYAPLLDEASGRYVHVGASVRYRENGGAGEPLFRYRQRPLAHLAPQTVATPRFADSDLTWGLEAAAASGPFHVEAEYAALSAEGPVAEADFNGFTVSGGWFITGEHRTYKAAQGRFDRTEPARPAGRGGFGAFEVAARYDMIDLQDGAIAGGDQFSWTLGGNWYPTAYSRVSVNYVDADIDGGPFAGGDAETIQARFQIDW